MGINHPAIHSTKTTLLNALDKQSIAISWEKESASYTYFFYMRFPLTHVSKQELKIINKRLTEEFNRTSEERIVGGATLVFCKNTESITPLQTGMTEVDCIRMRLSCPYHRFPGVKNFIRKKFMEVIQILCAEGLLKEDTARYLKERLGISSVPTLFHLSLRKIQALLEDETFSLCEIEQNLHPDSAIEEKYCPVDFIDYIKGPGV